MNNIKVALVCIAKNEDYYLDEWLEYNHKLGFNHIFLYENDWRCNLEKPYLTKIKCDGKVKQLFAYNSFIENNKEFDWVAFIDCDEFITLVKHNNIKEFINEYDNTNGISLNWFYFGSGDLLKRESNSLLKQFQHRSSKTDKHIKVIMNLKKNFKMILPHNSNISVIDTNRKLFNGSFNYGGPSDVAYINHYRNKTYEDFILRCERGRADCELVAKITEWEKQRLNNIDVIDTIALDYMYKK